MPVLHDLRCDACGTLHVDVAVDPEALPRCSCGSELAIDWSHGKAPATDMHEPRFNHATGQWHRSSHETDLAMAKQCREWSARTGRKFWAYAAGDKVGGARQDLTTKGSAFGFGGQRIRRSSRERELEAGRARRSSQSQAPRAPAAPHPGAPRSVSASEAREILRRPTWSG